MKRNNSLIGSIYLPCAFAFMLFFVCLLFQVLGYWVSGGENIIGLVKDNIYFYFEMAGLGLGLGFILWLFNIR